MTVKYILGVLCVCFLVSGSLGLQSDHPLCDIVEDIMDENWRTKTIESIFDGNNTAIECLAGCLIYTANELFEKPLKNILSVGYVIFEGCIKTGIRNNNTCDITYCVLNAAENGINMYHSMGLKIPIIDDLLGLPIFGHKDTYEVVTEPALNSRQLASISMTSKKNIISETTETPKAAQTQSSNTSGTTSLITTLGLTNIFGITILCRIIF